MHKLTIVLISCGENTESLSFSSIYGKPVEINWVKNEYPQIRALNKMIDSVETEYFAELNADIVLHGDWYDRALNKLNSWEDSKCYSVIFALWDVLTQERILAFKLFKTEIMKRNMFNDVPTPDIEHYNRMIKNGFYTNYKPSQEDRPIGYHFVQGPRCCYSKYKDVYKTLRTHNFEWDSGVFKGGKSLETKVDKHYNFFMTRYNLTGDTDYLWCIIGMVEGLSCELDGKSKTYDFQLPKLDSVFDEAIASYERWKKREKRESYSSPGRTFI